MLTHHHKRFWALLWAKCIMKIYSEIHILLLLLLLKICYFLQLLFKVRVFNAIINYYFHILKTLCSYDQVVLKILLLWKWVKIILILLTQSQEWAYNPCWYILRNFAQQKKIDDVWKLINISEYLKGESLDGLYKWLSGLY